MLIQQMLQNLFLKENRDHLLAQARSELMKQEHKVESLNYCLNELQQQAYAQRLELQDAHHGSIEFRRDRVPTTRRISQERKSSSRNSN